MTPTLQILEGDWSQKAREIPDVSVHCCVTSPPYWGLRNYGVAGQLGLEKTPEEYVAKMVEVFREVKRVLRDDGTLWLNLGDSFSGGKSKNGNTKGADLGWSNEQHRPLAPGLKPKDLCGIPWRVAFALQQDGWFLRSDIIWHKPNPMPESVTDRPTKSHEYLFLLSKSQSYFYDAEAIKEPLQASSIERWKNPNFGTHDKRNGDANHPERQRSAMLRGELDQPNGRNKRTVWTIATASYPESHFATFPPDLVKPCVLAGSSARGCCPKCGTPWERIVEKSGGTTGKSWHDHEADLVVGQRSEDQCVRKGWLDGSYKVETLGWQPTCECQIEEDEDFEQWEDEDGSHVSPKPIACTVLDPFLGSGTTAMVAMELGRNAIGCELSPEYIKLARQRCAVTPGLAL